MSLKKIKTGVSLRKRIERFLCTDSGNNRPPEGGVDELGNFKIQKFRRKLIFSLSLREERKVLSMKTFARLQDTRP